MSDRSPSAARSAAAVLVASACAISAWLSPAASAAETPTRSLYFGDTHLHTSWSPDAFLMGNRSLSPDDAYRFAKGLPGVHPMTGAEVQLETPLDFLMVSDHAEFMGVIPMIFGGDPRVANSEGAKAFMQLVKERGVNAAFQNLVGQVVEDRIDPALLSPEINQSVWKQIIAAAERHNAPGSFTALIGWEWSALPEMANLHRVVVLRDGAAVAERFVPFSSFDSNKAEDLWDWLDATSQRTGAHFLAIPHNSNISLGRMFPLVNARDGAPIDAAHARTSARWEPVVEVTQVKGDSETHAVLSPTDEFARYEEFMAEPDKADAGSYARSALRRGLEIEARTGVNPYQFGMIGATDAHTGLATAEENNFQQKWGMSGTPKAVMLDAQEQMNPRDMGAAGLAAVWAEANTREALFDALRRREVYATTGTRLHVRFFGGWDFGKGDAKAQDIAQAGYKKGVPMGGLLGQAKAPAPSFLVRAAKDPVGANLDRVQIVKGWVDASGTSHERIYDVALADGRKANKDGNVEPVGNTVDLATARYTNDIGDTELAARWRDPDFDEAQSAFYYARVLEIPTPRHTLFDALALGMAHPPDLPATIQERAYTSPIWYRPQP